MKEEEDRDSLDDDSHILDLYILRIPILLSSIHDGDLKYTTPQSLEATRDATQQSTQRRKSLSFSSDMLHWEALRSDSWLEK